MKHLPVGVESIVISVNVCLSLRSLMSKNTSKFHEIFCVTCGRGSVLLCRQCDTLCTSGFVDDVMFHIMEGKGPNQRVTKTHMFRPVRQMAAPGAKTTVSYCILLKLFYLITN